MWTARAAALFLLCAGPAAAQQPAGSAVSRDVVWPLPRLQGEIVLDGRSDEPAWQAVAPVRMSVYLPNYGAPPSERTEARVGYDSEAIYVMVDAWEAHEGGVRASSMIRDDDSPGDFINVLLDTFGDRQTAVSFSTTPGGQRNDWSISNDAREDASLSPHWNGPWDLAVRRGPDGWHAEYRIPFTTLRFTARNGRAEMGFSLNRLTAHSNERQTFPSIEPSAPLALWKPSRWQRVSIEDITTVRSLRVMPYVMAGSEGNRAPDPVLSPWHRDQRFEAGGDLKTALSPNLNLDLTVNTDFAEAEVDDQRVNLTRFPLFFPERRAFFVERAGTFEVKTGEVDLLFNSRRVGLTPDGDPVRLLGGARLVGRVLGWDLGLLDVQTGRTPAGSRENLGVLRARRGLLNQRSWAGLMLTSRVTPDSGQVALGADGELYLGGDDYVGFAFAALAGDAGLGPDDGVLPRGALRLLAERRRNRGMWYRGGVATTGARYEPAMGYVEREDAIQPLAELGYGWVVSPAGHQLRASAVSAFAYRNGAGTFDGSVASAALEYELPTGSLWTLTVTRQEDDLLVPFNPVPDALVPAGRYTAGYAELKLKPSTGPRAVVGGTIRAGEYYDGRLYSMILSPEWRASAHVRLSADLQLDRLEFPDRDQRVWSTLARLRVLASANPRLSLSAVLQANGSADLATANLRLRYSVSEGHDLWVVYNHDQNLDRDRGPNISVPGTARSGLLVKYTRSFGR